MKELLLDAETLYTREQLHDVLTKVCGFPADYGRNLDALYDLLTAYPAARLTPQRTARKRAYNRKRRSMPPLFIKSRDMCVGFYTSKGFCVPAKRARRIPPQTCPSYCSACPPRSRAWS